MKVWTHTTELCLFKVNRGSCWPPARWTDLSPTCTEDCPDTYSPADVSMCWTCPLFWCSEAPPSSAFLWVRWRSAVENAAPAQSGTATEPHSFPSAGRCWHAAPSWLMITELRFWASASLCVWTGDGSGMTQDFCLCWVVITSLLLFGVKKILLCLDPLHIPLSCLNKVLLTVLDSRQVHCNSSKKHKHTSQWAGHNYFELISKFEFIGLRFIKLIHPKHIHCTLKYVSFIYLVSYLSELDFLGRLDCFNFGIAVERNWKLIFIGTDVWTNYIKFICLDSLWSHLNLTFQIQPT